MKKTFVIVIAILILFILGYLLLRGNSNITNAPPENDLVLIFGDSLTEGVGANEGNDLASRFSRHLGRTVLNYGRSGDTTRDALDRLPEAIAEDAGLVIVILGDNDVLKKVPQEETFRNLEKIVTAFQDQGAVVILVGVRSGLVGGGRDSDFEAVAEKTRAAYVPDILKGIFADSRFMSDAGYANDAGYAKIAERIAPSIAALYKN